MINYRLNIKIPILQQCCSYEEMKWNVHMHIWIQCLLWLHVNTSGYYSWG